MSGGRRKEEPPQPHLANGAPKSSAWSKALRSDAAWEDKDEFLDVIYWFRQIIAVVLGVIWGVVPLKGFVGIAVFCLINAGILYLYFSSFQQIDEEDYGGTWELTKEGFMTSFALFMVILFNLQPVVDSDYFDKLEFFILRFGKDLPGHLDQSHLLDG
uniref:RAB5 interacting factor n=1 Tax=Monodelphis domestica TaxID=13616 RepID=A0A5F8G5Q3_MONDO